MLNNLSDLLRQGDMKALARSISLIENEHAHYDDLLKALPYSKKKIIGITGPPGAGKSTLVDGLISEFIQQQKKIGVLCVDPSSPFNMGALLGDRIRMSTWYNHPGVFIRSLASRGNLGGLHPKIIEISDVMKAAPFDHIIVETVGAGQTETEIAGLADTTVVVLVPEAGDEIQTMKAGLMEIADIFVVNKSDRPEADRFVKHLVGMLSPSFHSKQNSIPVIKTIAAEKKGIHELMEKILWHQNIAATPEKRSWLIAEKAYQLIQRKRMKDVNRRSLVQQIQQASAEKNFNLYKFIENF
jgi:LAO/AO transport system kinase